jgi:pimeloyl-ACP methyl ester carboxylesterase/DNA-binding winged helix-turn-helix (wHTH) protein
MHTGSPTMLCFGAYALDLLRCALLHGDEEVRLRPKSHDVLRYLAEHVGQLVSKEELIQAVWSGTFVTDDSLVQCVREIREALHDEDHRIIKTVPRRGYLFAADVTRKALAKPGPGLAGRNHEITFCRTSDGVNIAVGSLGQGKPLIRTSTWFNHLEYEWENPLRAPLLNFLADRCHLIRYDGRGNGLSNWDVADISFEGFLEDLRTVVHSLRLDRYALIGTSQGAAIGIAHATRHPERVSKLILHGGSARGRKRRNSPRELEMADALLALIRHGWGDERSVFMRMFVSRYMPNGSPQQIKWLAQLQQMATSADNAVRMRRALDVVDVVDLLPKVSVPTLVLHCRHDSAVPFDEGRLLAASIPHAKFVVLESENHIPIAEEAAWPRFVGEIEAFLSD